MAQIETAYIDMFSSNVMHLSQQKASRLFKYCLSETQKAEKKGYDRVGKRTARRKEGRHSDVEYTETPHSRRWVTMDDYYDADLVDNEDKLRTIMEPENEYAVAISGSLGRQLDEIIIDFSIGSAITGKTGTGSTSLPDSQKVVCFNGSTTTGVGLNTKTMRAVKKKFWQAEAISEGEMLIWVCAAQQLDDLLGQTEVTSSDYNTVKALAQGDLDTYMGFKFERTELLTFSSSAVTYNVTTGAYGSGTGTIPAGDARINIVFTANRALKVGHGDMIKGRVSEIAHKHYANQVYASLQAGGVRMEEEQVVAVYCFEP